MYSLQRGNNCIICKMLFSFVAIGTTCSSDKENSLRLFGNNGKYWPIAIWGQRRQRMCSFILHSGEKHISYILYVSYTLLYGSFYTLIKIDEIFPHLYLPLICPDFSTYNFYVIPLWCTMYKTNCVYISRVLISHFCSKKWLVSELAQEDFPMWQSGWHHSVRKFWISPS